MPRRRHQQQTCQIAPAPVIHYAARGFNHRPFAHDLIDTRWFNFVLQLGRLKLVDYFPRSATNG
jgi:hypothetical protein